MLGHIPHIGSHRYFGSPELGDAISHCFRKITLQIC
jgi:hypothetical protein